MIPLLIVGAGIGATVAAELGFFGKSAKPSKLLKETTTGAKESLAMMQMLIPFIMIILTLMLVAVAIK